MRFRSAIYASLIPALLAAISCGKQPAFHASTGPAVLSNHIDSVVNVPEEDFESHVLMMADSIMLGMTLEQKVGQCFMPTILSSVDSANFRKYREYIHDLKVGGIVLLRGDMLSAAQMSAMAHDAKVPLFVAIDAEWGLGMRLADAPVFPRNGLISRDADELLLYDYGAEVARECGLLGINMVLGPVVDVVDRSSGVIGTRAFGSSPERVASLGVAYAKGLEDGGVVSVAKHFPGHGSQGIDSHLHLPVIDRPIASLDSIDILPFRRYINAGLTGIMVGHLAVSAIDSVAIPAAVSRGVIFDLLRTELSFNGLVITDALNMGAVKGFTAADAIAAGADMVVGPTDTGWEIDNVIEKVKRGDISTEDIDERCRRILFHKYLLQLNKPNKICLEGIKEDVIGDSDSLKNRLSGK